VEYNVIVGTISSRRCLASENKRNAPKRVPNHINLHDEPFALGTNVLSWW